MGREKRKFFPTEKRQRFFILLPPWTGWKKKKVFSSKMERKLVYPFPSQRPSLPIRKLNKAVCHLWNEMTNDSTLVAFIYDCLAPQHIMLASNSDSFRKLPQVRKRPYFLNNSSQKRKGTYCWKV